MVIVYFYMQGAKPRGFRSFFVCPMYPPTNHHRTTNHRRDRDICRLAQSAGVQVFSSPSHTLHDPEAYMAKLKGAPPPIAYQSFVKLFLSMGAVGPVGCGLGGSIECVKTAAPNQQKNRQALLT